MEAEVLTTVVQITNIAPQATRDQMLTLFSYVGKIEDLRLYPTLRDVSMNVNARCCFVKFSDSSCVPVAQHLTNTVFIDRAIIVTPVKGEIPNEQDGLVMASQFQQQGSSVGNGVGRLGSSGVNGSAVSSAPVTTPFPKLDELGLPPYPVLPVGTPLSKVDEMRRTITVVGIDSTVSAQACMEMFSEAGEVKYFRYCMRIGDPIKYALIEFTEQDSVPRALQFNDRSLGMSKIKVTHSIQAINKPQAKSSEAVQREIEEAMSKVKETQSLVSAAVDPLMGILGGSSRSSRTRSRSRSRSRRSRSRDRSLHSSRRSHSRDRRRRSRSRSRDRRRSRSRDRRRRSRSRDRKRSKRSKSRSREKRKRSRSRSRDRKKDKEKENKSGDKEKIKEKEKVVEVDVDAEKAEKSRTPEVAPNETSLENGSANEDAKVLEVEGFKRKSRSRSKSKKRSRSRSRSKKRLRSREKKRKSRSRSRDRKRSRSRDKDRKSRRSSSKDRRRKRSRDRKRKSRSRSKERSSKSSKSSRNKDKSDLPKASEASKGEESKNPVDCDDMEISNSP